jgi:hypothetical protein
MHGEPHRILTDEDRFGRSDRDQLGRFKRGNNARYAKEIRIAAKVEQLRHEFFPCGGESQMDASRLMLAAKHYVTAETCRDPVVSQRATRCAEYLLTKIKRQEEPVPSLEELGL